MKKHYIIPERGNEREMTCEEWLERTGQYGQVLEYQEKFAKLTGRTLIWKVG